MRVLTCVLLVSVAAAADQEMSLRPGPFPHLPGATLGERVEFENDIDGSYCYPLVFRGQVVSWLAGAYAYDGKLLVQRCIEFYDPIFETIPANRHGSMNEWWEEARLSADGDALLTTRLKLPGWSYFSSASFCRASMSYWAFRGNTLEPTIYDLRARRVLATRNVGVPMMETDNRGVLPPAEWDATCSEATFDGTRVERPIVKLKAPPRG